MVATCPAYLEIIAPGTADSKNCHIVNHPALYHAPPSRAFFLWPVHLWWRISPALFPNPVLSVLPRSGIVAPATSCSRQLQPQLCEGAGYEYRPETGGSHDSSVPASHPSVDASHVSYTLHLGLTTLVISNYFLYLKERVWFAASSVKEFWFIKLFPVWWRPGPFVWCFPRTTSGRDCSDFKVIQYS